MIRLILTTSDGTHMMHTGGQMETFSRSFDIDLPQLEKLLSEPIPQGNYISRSLSYEILNVPAPAITDEEKR